MPAPTPTPPSTPTRLRQPQAIDDMLLFRLSRLLAVGGAAVVRLCEGRYGITRREWAVLSLLWQQQGQGPSELADRVQLDRARTSKALAQLLEVLSTPEVDALDQALARLQQQALALNQAQDPASPKAARRLGRWRPPGVPKTP